MTGIYMWREENNNNNSHPKLNTCIIIVPVFWNKTSSSLPTSFSSPSQNWTTSFFFSSLSCVPCQRTESYLLCCNKSLTHFQRYIFHDRERYNQITWLERNKSSWSYFTVKGDKCKCWNKMAANFEDLKKSLKNRFWSESKIFQETSLLYV